MPHNLAQAVTFYDQDLPHAVMVSTKYRMWVRKWKQHSSDVPKKLVDALQICDTVTFTNMNVLLYLAHYNSTHDVM